MLVTTDRRSSSSKAQYSSVSTLLVWVDNKHRYKFLSWQDEEFIEDLNWLNKKLENIKGEVTLLGITNLDESGINYRITVETIPLKNAEIERKILKEVKLELDKNGITIPYKQVVIRNA